MARDRTAIKACCDHKSREYALSLCGVTFRETLCARLLRSPEHTITTNALYVSDSASNVSSTNPKEKLGLEQRSGATDFRSKGYRMSTCRFPTDIRFRSLTIARVLIITPWDHTNIKHVLRALLLETSTFSGVSLNTLLVLTHRRILRPSPQLAWRIGGSPNLIIASCSGSRPSFSFCLHMKCNIFQQKIGSQGSKNDKTYSL